MQELAHSRALPQSPAAGSGMATEEAMEELWKSFLALFLGCCLLALGGAEAGVTQDGRPGFRMRDGGRVLLGLPRDALPDRDEEEAGVLFRLTRQSLLRAAAAGLETEQVLATLTQGSRNPVPPNVEHEIRGWMAAAAPRTGRRCAVVSAAATAPPPGTSLTGPSRPSASAFVGREDLSRSARCPSRFGSYRTMPARTSIGTGCR